MSCSQLMHVVYTNCQPQPAPARPFVAASGRGDVGGGWACQDTDEKYDKTLLNHLKILQLTLLFFIRLMKVFRLFGFCCCLGNKLFRDLLWPPCPPPTAAVAAAAQQQPPWATTINKANRAPAPAPGCPFGCSLWLARSAASGSFISFFRPCGGIKGFAAYQVINIYKASCTKMTYSKLNIKLNLHKMFLL